MERYIFRVLGMLDDYFAGLPIRDKYFVVNRYKHKLENFYLTIAENFRDSLTVKKNTISMLYSIASNEDTLSKSISFIGFGNAGSVSELNPQSFITGAKATSKLLSVYLYKL